METLKLHWLGQPLIELKERAVKLETRKAAALLAYLSLNSGECQREFLATMFWPEESEQKALANLRRTLSSLNSSLPGWIKADRTTITLKRDVKLWVDVDAFRQSLSHLRYQSHQDNEVCEHCLSVLDKTVELYRGDFLEGLNLTDAPRFDEWQFFQRDGLRQEFAHILQRLSSEHAERGQWEEAIASARQWVALDHLHEPACRTLMDLYIRSGQRTAALRQYHELTRFLNEQLGLEPDEETRRLYEGIRGRDEATHASEAPQGLTALPLLKTKLYFPTAPASRVKRSHLIDCLGEVERKALTIISAPAGFGKTTLLAEWIAQTPLPVAWLSVDNSDNDPYRFLAYLIAALENIREDVGTQARQFMKSPQLIPLHIILASLINDLGRVAEPYVLVLDDYHFITEHAVHEMMAYLLDHLPANLHLVIAARADPPLQLGRLRAHGRMLELRTQDLRFTSEEAIEFLSAIMGLGLSAEDIQTLESRTEGWVVGLQMAALSLKGHENVSEFIQDFSGSDRYVLDYLTEEVLRRQPAHVQTFLLETSILDKLNGSLCEVLMKDEWKHLGESGQAVLEYLDSNNLFIIPLDDKKQWFRYHHLFADLLHSRLDLYAPGRDGIRQVLASRWFERNNMIDEAVQYSTLAKDYLRVIELVEKNAPAMVRAGKLAAILAWLRPLPDGLILENPWISTLFAWGLVTRGEMKKAEPYLLSAFQKIETAVQVDERNRLLGTIATLRALVYESRADTKGTIEMAHLALENLGDHDEVARLTTKFALGKTYYLSGDLARAKGLCQEFLQACGSLGANNGIAAMASTLGNVLTVEGRLGEAETAFRKGIKMLEDRGPENCFVAGVVYLDLGELMRQRNELAAAKQLIERGIELNDPWGVISVTLHGFLARARLLITLGELESARQWILKGKKLEPDIHSLSDIGRRFRACQAQWRLAEGDSRAAHDLLAWDHMAAHDDLDFRGEVSHIMLARVLIAERSLDEALALLHRLEIAAQAGARGGSLIEIWTLQAIALQARARMVEALLRLRQALALAEPEGYVRIFLDEGEPMIKLLKRLTAPTLTPQLSCYVSRLLEVYTSMSKMIA